MVIFVDELDRCKPTFAVHFVERIKHFFAVDHLVFVLVMNKEQLERSIQACYGNGVNGGAYLQKFISIWVTIGFQVTSDEDGRKHGKYVEKLFNHYQLHSFFENDTYSFCNLITESANYFNTSLRETEKVFANLTIALSVAGKGKYPWIYECIVLLAFYKVIFPEHYRALVLVSKPDSHPIWPTEYLSTRHTWVDKSSTSKEISYLRGILNNPKIKEVYNGFPSFAKHLRRFFEFASTK